MKKWIACLLLAVLLCGATALSEVGDRRKVVNCEEYVTLREWPETSANALARIPLGKVVEEVGEVDGGFTLVSWRGQSGYVLSRYLRTVEDWSGSSVRLDDDERYNLNLFLSNFTEADFGRAEGGYREDWADPDRKSVM